jgi:hypothetical protein
VRFILSILSKGTGFSCLVSALQFAISTSHAATFVVSQIKSDLSPIIIVSGEFKLGDEDRFRDRVSSLSTATVAFDSPGGNVVAAISIGEIIRSKNFGTAVLGHSRCVSACALAWLSGAERFMSSKARIGFHAAYDYSGRETAAANAVVGAYMDKLGLPYAAVIYVTQAAPNSMTWLRIADAEQSGISVKLLPNQPPASDPSSSVVSPQGHDTRRAARRTGAVTRLR